jgi:hypothetical protein
MVRWLSSGSLTKLPPRLLLDGVQPNSGQDIIPANTLQAGKNYRYSLFFANDLVRLGHYRSRCLEHHDDTIIMMRTTINLPDDVYQVARSLAATKGIPLGEALAELVRRQFSAGRQRIDTRKAFPSFVLSDKAKPITLEQTLAMEDEL